MAVFLIAGCAGTQSTSKPPPAPRMAAEPAYSAPVAHTRTSRAPRTTDLYPRPTEAIEATAPEQYIVKKGDTLWDIAGKFLSKPWYWPEIWHSNPDIKNPHLIYPGDVITLYYVDGQPRLGINIANTAAPSRSGKLSPSIHSYPLTEHDVGVPIRAIRPFLIRPQIIAEEQLKQAPHILDSEEHRLIYGSGDRLYVRNLTEAEPGAQYSVFRPGQPLVDPDTKELLGFQAIYASDAEVVRAGSPATIQLHHSVREVLRGDRLLPLDPGARGMYFTPKSAPANTRGKIISLFDAISQVAQYQIAVVNLGSREGLETGQVLSVKQKGRTILDAYHQEKQDKNITLPMEETGLMMIFRSFEKVSYGLIMESRKPIRIGDTVTNP